MRPDEPHTDHDPANDAGDHQSDTVIPFARPTAGAGVTVQIDHIETTPITDEQYRLAVTALAELINHWKHTQQHPPNRQDDAA